MGITAVNKNEIRLLELFYEPTVWCDVVASLPQRIMHPCPVPVCMVRAEGPSSGKFAPRSGVCVHLIQPQVNGKQVKDIR